MDIENKDNGLNTVKARQRKSFIDIAKGIAIISIILGHLGVNQINRVVFTFHVPLFFIITGYFINNKYSIKDFVIKKFKRLIIPYLSTSIVLISISFVVSVVLRKYTTEFNVKEIFLAALYGAGDNHNFLGYNFRAIGAIWFLLATFWGSALIRILINFKKMVQVFGVLLLFLIGYYSAKLLWLPLSIQAGFCSVLFMYVGYLISIYFDMYKEYYYKYKKFIIIFSLIMWFQFIYNFKSFWLVHCDFGRGVIDIIGSLCACYIIIVISKLLEIIKVSKIIERIGKESLLILCVHIIDLTFIPWDSIITINNMILLKQQCIILFKALGRVIFDTGFAMLLSKSKLLKKFF